MSIHIQKFGSDEMQRGVLIYNDNGVNKRVKFAYMGDGTTDDDRSPEHYPEHYHEHELIYNGGNWVHYHIDDPNDTILNPQIKTRFRWNGENVLNGLDFTPEKDGYEFTGWRFHPDDGGYLTEVTMLGDVINLYATFRKTVTLTFFDCNSPTSVLDYGERRQGFLYYNNGVIEAPRFTATPTPYSGYEFVCWTNGTNWDSPQKYKTIVDREFTDNETVYAIYHKNVSYITSVNGVRTTVTTYTLNGHTYPLIWAINASDMSNIHFPLITLQDQSLRDATFDGWNTTNEYYVNYYPISDTNPEHTQKAVDIPLNIDGAIFYALFAYANYPLDDPEHPEEVTTVQVKVNASKMVDGSDVGSWLKLQLDDESEQYVQLFDGMKFDKASITGWCTVDGTDAGFYLRDTYNSLQSTTAVNSTPTFANVEISFPKNGGQTALCIATGAGIKAYATCTLSAGLKVFGRKLVG